MPSRSKPRKVAKIGLDDAQARVLSALGHDFFHCSAKLVTADPNAWTAVEDEIFATIAFMDASLAVQRGQTKPEAVEGLNQLHGHLVKAAELLDLMPEEDGPDNIPLLEYSLRRLLLDYAEKDSAGDHGVSGRVPPSARGNLFLMDALRSLQRLEDWVAKALKSARTVPAQTGGRPRDAEARAVMALAKLFSQHHKPIRRVHNVHDAREGYDQSEFSSFAKQVVNTAGSALYGGDWTPISDTIVQNGRDLLEDNGGK